MAYLLYTLLPTGTDNNLRTEHKKAHQNDGLFVYKYHLHHHPILIYLFKVNN
jgi:hypothetical protein